MAAVEGNKVIAKDVAGFVKWFNTDKGYGFITGQDGKDYFVHYSSIVTEDNYKSLTQDQEVMFDVSEGDKGEQAVNVIPGTVPSIVE